MLEPRFQKNASWLISQTALAETFTMTDNQGRPIWTNQIINGDGMPMIAGKKYTQVVQMPGFKDAAGNVVPGSKSLGLGDWKKNYMFVNRRGFTMMRDPYSMQKCGVNYHFSQRVGGDVLCRNAAIFLQTK
jgi:HK97 family phage major capsid protein